MAQVKAKETKWNEETKQWESREILVENNLDNEFVEDNEVLFNSEEELEEFLTSVEEDQ